MFVESLGTDDGIRLLKLIAFIAHADGTIDSAEVALLRSVEVRLGLTPRDWVAEIDDIDLAEVCGGLSPGRSRLLVYAELLNACFIDGRFTEDEHRGLARIAELLRLSDGEREATEAWIAEGVAWQERGAELFGLQP